jgi:cytochrome c5
MKMTAIQFAGLTWALLSLGSMGAQQPSAKLTSAKPEVAKKAVASPQPAATADDPGQRKFEQNCSRCHTAPEQLSPRIVGTVVRHMRVRASLSAQDEQDILRFLAP